MKWFKHLTCAFDDEKLSAVVDELGMEGYGFWWRILEVVAEKLDENGDCSCTFSAKKWGDFFGFSAKKFEKFVIIFQKNKLFEVIFFEKCICVNIPNLLKFRDEWSRKKDRNSGVSPETLRSKEEDKEEDKELKTECVLSAGVGARVERMSEDVPGKTNRESTFCRQPSIAFDQLYDAYPEQHRGGRMKAERVWAGLEARGALPGLPRLFDALAVWEASPDWQEQGGRFVPTLENFLAGEYWLRTPKGLTARSSPGWQQRPRANTVAQQRIQDNDDMAKMLLHMRRAQHAQSGLHASAFGQSGAALPAGR